MSKSQPCASTVFEFEAERFSRKEDAVRARRIRRVINRPGTTSWHNFKDRVWLANQRNPRVRSPAIDVEAAQGLAQRLEEGVSGPFPPASLASSLGMRTLRMGLNRRLLDAFAPYPDEELRTFTVIYAGWTHTPTTLDTVTAKRLTAQFRTHLVRAGVMKLAGPLFAVLHGEYEPSSGVYVIHFHGVTSAAKAAVIKAGLSASKIAGYTKTATGAAPVVCKRVRDRERQFSYLAKAYWPSKPLISINGVMKRRRRPLRMPESFGTQVLLWLDRQRFADLVLMSDCWSLRKGGTPAMKALYLFVKGIS